jgi:hypothetical protein
MKIKDLKPIIDRYNQEKGLRRRWFKPLEAMQRLFDLYHKNDRERVLPDHIVQRMLDDHWREIQGTSRSYVQEKLNPRLKETEIAYISLAEYFETHSEAALSSAVEVKKEATLKAAADAEKRVALKAAVPLAGSTGFMAVIQSLSNVLFSSASPEPEVKAESEVQAVAVVEAKPSYMKIATLMPGAISFTQRINFNPSPMLVSGRVFHYGAFVDELKEHGDILSFTAFSQIFKSYDKSTAKILRDAITAIEPTGTDEQRIELQHLKEISVTLFEDFDLVREFQVNAVSMPPLRMPAYKIPSRYSFKTADNLELDIRTLFFTGFVNPVTRLPFASSDMHKLMTNPVLGSMITACQGMTHIFVLPGDRQGAVAVDFRRFDFKAFSENRDGLSLKRRQEVYAHFTLLLQLMDHFNFEGFLPRFPSSYSLEKVNWVRFETEATRYRKTISWSEMSDAEFFQKAAPLLGVMKAEMGGDWDSSANNFFAAMKEFSENAEGVVTRSSGGYIRSNGEYVVRVESIATHKAAVLALNTLVSQFRGAFEIAYSRGHMETLIRGMTPSGICIAEKMLHLGGVFAKLASQGPNSLGSYDDVFAMVMQKARKAEISQGATWQGKDFLEYLLKNHKDRTAYNDSEGRKRMLDEKAIRSYLIDVMCYEDVKPYVDPGLKFSLR